MLYLILAVMSSAMVSIVMRLSVGKINNKISMLSASYVTCMLLTFIYIYPIGRMEHAEGKGTAVFLGVTAGILLLAGFVLLQFNVQINGVMLSAAFSKLGVLVPTILAVAVFEEMMKGRQIAGFLLALSAILLINFEKDQINAKSKISLLILLAANGAADAMAKIYEELGNPALKDMYLCITFIVASLLSAGFAVMKKQKIGIQDIFWGFMLGIPNYYSVRFLMKALGEIPAVILYPTYSVTTIVVISTAGMVLFKEKLSRRQSIATGIILVSLVLLNI